MQSEEKNMPAEDDILIDEEKKDPRALLKAKVEAVLFVTARAMQPIEIS